MEDSAAVTDTCTCSGQDCEQSQDASENVRNETTDKDSSVTCPDFVSEDHDNSMETNASQQRILKEEELKTEFNSGVDAGIDNEPVTSSSRDADLGHSSSPSSGVSNHGDRDKEEIRDHNSSQQESESDIKVEKPPSKCTRFFIDDILGPAFGGRTSDNIPYSTCNPLNLKHNTNNSAFDRVEGKPDNFLHQHSSSSEQPLSAKDQPHGPGETGAPGDKPAPPGTAGRTPLLWPAWVYCTRYSDRPSSGPRSRKAKRKERKCEEKRPRTAFSSDQLLSLRKEFDACRYLTEQRRQTLASSLQLSQAQVKIWFQNKRAKMKKSTSPYKNPLALSLMAQGLYNHSSAKVKVKREGHDDLSP